MTTTVKLNSLANEGRLDLFSLDEPGNCSQRLVELVVKLSRGLMICREEKRVRKGDVGCDHQNKLSLSVIDVILSIPYRPYSCL